ncbi:MFS transporter [Microbacterium sp. SS28]|uniref:MFS transporter n=1 Tax=Microbacterium sp. SS28 TaxID=2919948 RepID=UPI001FAA479B|nr:MFS transporter [Microbacterium sp. SS28]
MSSPTTTRRTPLVALLAADGVSRAGNAITTVAIPLIALDIGGTPLAAAAAGVAATLPLVVGGLIGGVVVDRLGFRRASIAADAASGLTVLAVPLLASLDALPLWALLVLVFLSNLLDAPGSSARFSQLPELAELAGVDLPRAAAAQATVSRTAMMLGAALAGLLIATVGAAPAMIVNGIAFAVAIVLTIAFVPRMALATHDHEREETGGWRGITAGIRFVWRTPLIRAVVLLVVVTNAVDIAGITVLKPVYAETLGHGGAELGIMIACMSGGALVGAALYGIIGDRLPRHGLFVVLFLLCGVPPYLTMALAPPFPVVAVVLVLSGLAAGPLNPLIDSALFTLVPPDIRARVIGAITAGVTAAMPLGSLLAGIGIDALGLTTTLVLASATYLTAILSLGFGRRWKGF